MEHVHSIKTVHFSWLMHTAFRVTDETHAGLQVDVSQEEGALGPGQKGAGPTLYGTPGAPLPCHGEDLSRIPAGFCYTPDSWSSLSATALSCGDDGCGASMAQCHATQQPATDLQGTNTHMQELQLFLNYDLLACLACVLLSCKACMLLMAVAPQSHMHHDNIRQYCQPGRHNSCDLIAHCLSFCMLASCLKYSVLMVYRHWTVATENTSEGNVACALGVSSAFVILSSLLTRTNFHVEDSLFGAYNILCHGAPKIWYVQHLYSYHDV